MLMKRFLEKCMCPKDNSDKIMKKAMCKSCNVKLYVSLIVGSIFISLGSILLVGYIPFKSKLMYLPFGLWLLTIVLVWVTATHKLFGKGAIFGANSIVKDLVDSAKSLFGKSNAE